MSASAVSACIPTPSGTCVIYSGTFQRDRSRRSGRSQPFPWHSFRPCAFCRTAVWDNLCFLQAPFCHLYCRVPPDMTVGARPLLSPLPLQLRAALYFTIFRQPRSDFLWLFFPALLLAKELKPAGFCPLLPAPFKHSAGAVQVHRKHCCPSLHLHLQVFLAVNKLWIKPRR